MNKHFLSLLGASVLLSVTFTNGFAQQRQSLLAPNSIGLVSSITNTYSGKGDLKAGGNTYKDVQINSVLFSNAQSLFLTEQDVATINLNYHQNDIKSGHKSDGQLILPGTLKMLDLSVDYAHEMNKRWTIASGLGVSSGVAETGLLKNGWGVSAYAVGVYKRSPNVTLYYGLGYNSLSDDWKLVPYFGCEWSPAPGWTVSLGVPKTAVSYSLRSNLTLSFEASGDGGTYYVKNDPRPGASGRSLAGSKLEYTEARIGFGAVWKIDNKWALSGSLGSAVYREFKYQDRDYKLKSKGAAPYVSFSVCHAF